MNLNTAFAEFGKGLKGELSSASVQGQLEDQLRTPFETLLEEIGKIAGYQNGSILAVGETAMRKLQVPPDYAVLVQGALAGYVELKAPGKGADPRAFTDKHDQEQWKRLRLLPNLLYTDGNAWSLWQNGELQGESYRLTGDVRSAGGKLQPAPGILSLFVSFLGWQPQPPRSARDLAHTAARLCRLLRDKVTEQLERKHEVLALLATEWRARLFPEADDEEFADGCAQAVTFGLLMARVRNIVLRDGLDQAALELSRGRSLIGDALRLLTGNEEKRAVLKTSLDTLTRVLDAVDYSRY